jgi:hypothetical protein
MREMAHGERRSHFNGEMTTKSSLRGFYELRFQLVYFHRNLAEIQSVTGDTNTPDIFCRSEICMQMRNRHSGGVILNILELCRHKNLVRNNTLQGWRY